MTKFISKEDIFKKTWRIWKIGLQRSSYYLLPNSLYLESYFSYQRQRRQYDNNFRASFWKLNWTFHFLKFNLRHYLTTTFNLSVKVGKQFRQSTDNEHQLRILRYTTCGRILLGLIIIYIMFPLIREIIIESNWPLFKWLSLFRQKHFVHKLSVNLSLSLRI